MIPKKHNACSVSKINCIAPIIAAIEIILGGSLISGGVYLAYMHGIGTISLIEIGGGGAVSLLGLVFITLVIGIYLSKKLNKPSLPSQLTNQNTFLGSNNVSVSDVQSNQLPIKAASQISRVGSSIGVELTSTQKGPKPIKGKLAICNPASAGALGEDISTLFSDTDKVERTDGKDWKQFPNEMLIKCEIFDTEKETPFTEPLYLPFCLFVHNDNYTDWKEEGEIIEFDYEGCHYELTFNKTDGSIPVKKMIEWCDYKFHEKGVSILPVNSNREKKKYAGRKSHPAPRAKRSIPCLPPSKRYLSPIFLQKHHNAIALSKQMKEKFNTLYTPSLPDLEFPFEPEYSLSQKALICKLPHLETAEGIYYYFEETSFAIYSYQKSSVPEGFDIEAHGVWVDPKEYPELWPSEFLLMMDYNETITREMIENGTKELKNGNLTITFPVAPPST